MKCSSTDLWQELRFLFTSTPVEVPLSNASRLNTWMKVITTLTIKYIPHTHRLIMRFLSVSVTGNQCYSTFTQRVRVFAFNNSARLRCSGLGQTCIAALHLLAGQQRVEFL